MLSNGRRAVAGLGRRVAVQGAQRLQTGNSSLIHSNPALSNREMAKPMGKDAAKVCGVRLRPWTTLIFSVLPPLIWKQFGPTQPSLKILDPQIKFSPPHQNHIYFYLFILLFVVPWLFWFPDYGRHGL